MKVILQQDVKGQGKKGQLVSVSDGYARNFLLPRNLAIEANASNMNVLKQKEAAEERRIVLEKSVALETAKALEGKIVKIYARGGSQGKLYGAVTSKEITEELEKQHGIAVNKKKILLSEEIKSFSTVEAEARIYPEISAKFYVTVIEAQD